MAKESARPEALKDRTANVGFASELLETEISQRNARKDAQENTARGVILTASALMTLLLALGKDAGVLDPSTAALARAFFVATLIAAAAAVGSAIGALWPREVRPSR